MLTRSQALLIAFRPLVFVGAACAALTQQQATQIEADNAKACDGLKSIPVIGMVAALVCPEEEAIAKAALDADVAAHPPASSAPVSQAAAALVVRPKVTRRSGGKRVHVGYFPPERAARCQAWIDALPQLDAGAVPAVPVASLVPFTDAGAVDAGAEGGK